MEEYFKLLILIAPVFLLILTGFVLRRFKWVTQEADASLMNLLIRVLFPCLILSVVLGSDSVRSSSSIIVPPLVGFGITALAMGVAWMVARSMGYRKGAGLRTFCFATGDCELRVHPGAFDTRHVGRGGTGHTIRAQRGCGIRYLDARSSHRIGSVAQA